MVTKLLALVLLSGASGLLYHVATSDDFRIATVVVAGNQLLTGSDLEAAAAVSGANIFWVRQEEVTRRLQTLPAVQTARVSTFLPNRLEIRVSERAPVAVWESGGTPYLVDQDGRVLGSTPTARQLPTIRDVGERELKPGSSVDRRALETVFRLQTLLPQVAATIPRQFEYSTDTGVTVVADFGSRLRIGGAEDLDWKVTALVGIRRELERTGQRAEIIDVRFKDRPYIR
ncbi:MAG: FtsQ-type POTRA domain-containing protein [Thermomicrobiales bacterium]|nr:FtsQ-type POTRA domain-containing protein [Thermomicrobiales bacterium]